MTVENISWSISTKECCRPRRGLNPRPPDLQSDGASNWATEAGRHLKQKNCLQTCAICTDSDHSGYAQSLIRAFYSVVCNDFVLGQWRPWLDTMDVQSDLGLRCPHMPKDRLLHGVAHVSIIKATQYAWRLSVIFTQETAFVTSCLQSCTPISFWKRSVLQGKNLLPKWRRKNNSDRVASSEVYQFHDYCSVSLLYRLANQPRWYLSKGIIKEIPKFAHHSW